MTARALLRRPASRASRSSSRVHPASCRCRDVCTARPPQPRRSHPAASAAGLMLAGFLFALTIITVADHVRGGPGFGVMVGQPGNAG